MGQLFYDPPPQPKRLKCNKQYCRKGSKVQRLTNWINTAFWKQHKDDILTVEGFKIDDDDIWGGTGRMHIILSGFSEGTEEPNCDCFAPQRFKVLEY